MRKFLDFLFSVEFHFSIFLFSGYFKQSFDIGIDLTLLFLITTFGLTLVRLIKKLSITKDYILPISLFSLLCVSILFSLVYTNSLGISKVKVIELFGLTLPAFLVPLIAFNKQSLKYVAISISSISIAAAFVVLPSVINNLGSVGFVGFEGSRYQGLARLMGVALVILVFHFYLSEKMFFNKFISLFFIILCAIVLMSTGSRMPVIAVAIGVVYYLMTSIKIKGGSIWMRKELKWVLFLLTLALPFVIYLAQKGFLTTLLYRFEVLFSQSDGGSSVVGRSLRIDTAIEMFGQSPFFGMGVGSFGLIHNGFDINDYPHNIFLELLAEQGLIGFIAFTSLLLVVTIRGFKLFNNKTTLVWFFVFMYFFLNAMVSGDINSNRMLFASMSFVLIAHHYNKVKTDTKENEMLKAA